MKKIFVIISNGEGGIATFQKYLIENISKLNHKIYFIDKKNNSTLKFLNIKLKSNVEFFKSNTIYDIKKVFNYLKLIKNREKNNKVIFVFSNPLLLIIYFWFLLFYFKNKKVNLFIHSHMLKINFSQIIINFLSSLISPFLDKTYLVSNFTKNWWLKYFFFYKLSNYEVFYNSVKIPRFIKNQNLNNIIGFVGRLEIEKGIDVFSDIARFIVKNNFKFEIFGDGSQKKKIFKHANVKINKWQKQEIIYKKFGILLVTSPIENCPFSVLEAKSYGIPTLSISDGGIKEIVKNNKDGILLNVKDMQNIKKSFFKIKQNYYFFKKNCLYERKKFDEKICYLKLINEM